MKVKNSLLILLFICIGVVLGTLVAQLTAGIPWLSWLAFGTEFGLKTPVVLDLGVLTLTFGFVIDLNVAVIIFVLIALIVGKKVS